MAKTLYLVLECLNTKAKTYKLYGPSSVAFTRGEALQKKSRSQETYRGYPPPRIVKVTVPTVRVKP